jgi:beta-N-acetylhexosaminidase
MIGPRTRRARRTGTAVGPVALGRRRTVATALLVGAVLAAALGVTACTSVRGGSGRASGPPSASTPSSRSPASRSSSAAPSRSPVPRPVTDAAHRTLARMTLTQRVGQLFMVNANAATVDPSAVVAVTTYHVGGLYLSGRAGSAQQTASIVTALQRQVGAAPPLFVSADQEGGEVQRFTGPGFAAIPSALAQGRVDPATLRAQATQWGSQLAAAGVNLNLAPVFDTVPSAAAAAGNPPIGGFDREYGYDPQTVAAHGVAVAQGLAAGGVATTAKHFPGLGRVTANTDTTAGVVDRVTTRHDAYLDPFAAAIKAGTPFVMMSTAIYARIDPAHPAAFSPTIIRGMLRGDLGFRGVIISDDLGAARQVGSVPVGDRAVRFLAAGGDLVLTVDNSQTPIMVGAVLARAQRDPSFRAGVDASALRVLLTKQGLGLLR